MKYLFQHVNITNLIVFSLLVVYSNCTQLWDLKIHEIEERCMLFAMITMIRRDKNYHEKKNAKQI